jgi:ABC-type antimicrobial peptide transport system permease subunit
MYSLINVSGLAVGMALCILAFAYVYHELSYNSFHDKYKQIYKIRMDESYDNGKTVFRMGESPYVLYDLLKTEYPEVLSSVCVFGARKNMAYKDKCFYEKEGLVASESFFNVFSFSLIKGDPNSTLSELGSIMLTETFAKKYFGNEDPMGKTVSLDKNDYIVTGIVRDVPANSDLKFDFLLSAGKTSKEDLTEMNEGVFAYATTFMVLPPGYDYKKFEAKLPALINKYFPKEYTEKIRLYVQPLSEVHLNSNFDEKSVYKSDLRYMYIFSGIALFLLFIACINFINLSIGLSSTRIKEIGVRKIIGASKKQIIRQFLGEMIILCVIAVITGFALAELCLPLFRQLLDKQIRILYDIYTFLFLGGLVITSGLISGGFTSLVFSRLQVIDILKTNIKIGGFNIFNRSLVVLQFSLSVFFIISAIVISKQLDFMKNQDLGLNKDNVLVMPVYNRANVHDNINILDRFRNELMGYNNIINISGASGDILSKESGGGIIYDEIDGKQCTYHFNWIDYNYFKTLEIPLITGRSFYKDEKGSILINESMVNLFNLKDPVGKQINNKTIVGVVKDFYYDSKHIKLEPLCLLNIGGYNFLSYILIKVRPENISQTIDLLGKKWKEISPDVPFEFSFLKDNIDTLYKDDERLSIAVNYSSILVIMLSCMGILGLTGLSINRQRKEISIRKVFGASVNLIVKLLSKEYMKLILIANIFAWPAAYYFISNWLQNFEYRINIPFYVFILSAILTIVVAFTTVGYQTIKAAMMNPIDSLRSE